jgi:DNA-binding transcriptional MerR regulator
LEQLEFIALGRHAGFTLEEIREMFAGDGHLQIDRKMLLAKADQLEDNIKRLVAVQNGLRHVAKCPAPNHLECPKFLRLLRVAGKITGKKQKKKTAARK